MLFRSEVGHALFTDNVDWTVDYPDVPKDFVNVIEDVRVERLMKKKYPGLSKTFYNGYNELNADDFFSTQEENLDKLSLIDRINLYFKIGAFHNIVFSDAENEFLTRISKLETFQEVLDIARELVEFVKYKREQLTEMPEIVENQGESGQEVELPPEFEQGEDLKRRYWFVMDELAALNRLPALEVYITRLRKYGGCLLAATQSFKQFYTKYGRDAGNIMLSQFNTNIVCRINDPEEAAMIMKQVGNIEYSKKQKNISFGAHEHRDGESYTDQERTRPLIDINDFKLLNPLEAYVLLPEAEVAKIGRAHV